VDTEDGGIFWLGWWVVIVGICQLARHFECLFG
jgi:hypothetical protein